MKPWFRGRKPLPIAMAAAFAALAFNASAHVDWTRVNAADPELLALYHMSDANLQPGQVLAVPTGLPPGRNLLIGAPTGSAATTTTDIVEPIFGATALDLHAPQVMESPATVDISGDISIEFWLKWPITLSAKSQLDIGLRSGPKIRLTRNPFVPAEDQFGMLTTHGDYVSSPGFTNWADFANQGEAELGEWLHFGLTIHSTGLTFDSGLNHDIYNPGSLARFWLNGHLEGAFPHTVDISGMRTHGDSTIRINNLSYGEALVDEVTIWKKDWSANGANANAFNDGRGNGVFPFEPLVWTRDTDLDPRVVAFYHFDDAITTAGNIIATDACLPQNRNMTTGASAGLPMISTADTPGSPLDPQGLNLRSAQDAATGTVLQGLADTTTEFWFKFNGSSPVWRTEIGLGSNNKIRIIRDQATPANDFFGLAASHGDTAEPAGFIDWPTLGSNAPTGEWLHAALSIDSPGFVNNVALGHDVWLPGSKAYFFLNNNYLGSVDISGLRAHHDSAIRIRHTSGDMSVDELAIWRYDWTNAGTDLAPFDDGRGDGGYSPMLWTRTNSLDSSLIGLWQFDNAVSATGDVSNVAAGLPTGLGLTLGSAPGGSMATDPLIPASIFAPNSMHLVSAQDANTTASANFSWTPASTVEYWFKWDDDGVTTMTTQLGISSGPKIKLVRAFQNPAKDFFGIATSHGDELRAPGFVDWPSLGDDAALCQWHHVAVTTYITGITFNVGLNHDVADPGSECRFWLDGKLFGGGPLDIAGMRVHDPSGARVRHTSGSVYVDEFTIWKKDWSQFGVFDAEFEDGRGDGDLTNSAPSWADYD